MVLTVCTTGPALFAAASLKFERGLDSGNKLSSRWTEDDNLDAAPIECR
jgi:hypothetical protein